HRGEADPGEHNPQDFLRGDAAHGLLIRLTEFGVGCHRGHVFSATGPVSVRGMRISTRRFLARPSGGLLSAIGAVSPLPSVWRRSGFARSGLNKAATLLARSMER